MKTLLTRVRRYINCFQAKFQVTLCVYQISDWNLNLFRNKKIFCPFKQNFYNSVFSKLTKKSIPLLKNIKIHCKFFPNYNSSYFIRIPIFSSIFYPVSSQKIKSSKTKTRVIWPQALENPEIISIPFALVKKSYILLLEWISFNLPKIRNKSSRQKTKSHRLKFIDKRIFNDFQFTKFHRDALPWNFKNPKSSTLSSIRSYMSFCPSRRSVPCRYR